MAIERPNLRIVLKQTKKKMEKWRREKVRGPRPLALPFTPFSPISSEERGQNTST